MKGARGADRVHLGTYRASYRLEYNDSNLSIYRKYKVFSDRCFCCLYKGFSVMLSGVFWEFQDFRRKDSGSGCIDLLI